MHTFKIILVLTPLAAIIDYLWLGVIAKGFYGSRLGDMLRPAGAQFDIRILGALAVYILLALGITLFVLPHASSYGAALLWGALFGFLVYAIYDFTNWAVFTHWPFSIVLVDIIWGTILNTILALVGFYLTTFFS